MTLTKGVYGIYIPCGSLFKERDDMLRKKILAVILGSLLLLGLVFVGFSTRDETFKVNSERKEQSEAYDALKTITTLNMSIMSISRIVRERNRIVLNQEYENIINNLKIGDLAPDDEMVDLQKTIMSSITGRLIGLQEEEIIRKVYERNIRKSLYESLGNIRAYGGSIQTVILSALISAGGAFFNYQNNKLSYQNELDKELWELRKQEIADLDSLQQQLLSSSWYLLNKYKLSDEYRITQDNINLFLDAIDEKDPSVAIRKFERISKLFEWYYPFWFYYGKKAFEIGDTKTALSCFEKLENVRRDILRRDSIYAEMCKVKLLMVKNSKEKERCADIIVQNSFPGKDWSNYIAAALAYYDLGLYEKAISALQTNLDYNVATEITEKLIEGIKSRNIDVAELTAEIAKWLDLHEGMDANYDSIVVLVFKQLRLNGIYNTDNIKDKYFYLVRELNKNIIVISDKVQPQLLAYDAQTATYSAVLDFKSSKNNITWFRLNRYSNANILLMLSDTPDLSFAEGGVGGATVGAAIGAILAGVFTGGLGAPAGALIGGAIGGGVGGVMGLLDRSELFRKGDIIVGEKNISVRERDLVCLRGKNMPMEAKENLIDGITMEYDVYEIPKADKIEPNSKYFLFFESMQIPEAASLLGGKESDKYYIELKYGDKEYRIPEKGTFKLEPGITKDIGWMGNIVVNEKASLKISLYVNKIGRDEKIFEGHFSVFSGKQFIDFKSKEPYPQKGWVKIYLFGPINK